MSLKRVSFDWYRKMESLTYFRCDSPLDRLRGPTSGASCPLVTQEQRDERGKLSARGANAEALRAILSARPSHTVRATLPPPARQRARRRGQCWGPCDASWCFAASLDRPQVLQALQRFARASKTRLLLYKKECRISLGASHFSLLHFILRHLDTLTLCVDNKRPLVPPDAFTSPSATMPHSTSPPRAPPTSPREPWCEEEFCSSIPTIPLQAIFNCAACIPSFATHTQCVYRHAQTNQHTHTSLARTPDVHISHTVTGKRIPH
jgi:hypothetical protein